VNSRLQIASEALRLEGGRAPSLWPASLFPTESAHFRFNTRNTKQF